VCSFDFLSAMILDAVAGCDLGADELDQLLAFVRAGAGRGDENRDLVARDAGRSSAASSGREDAFRWAPAAVISQITMQASERPRASSAKGAWPVGTGPTRRPNDAAGPRAARRSCSQTPHNPLVGQIDFQPRAGVSKRTRIRDCALSMNRGRATSSWSRPSCFGLLGSAFLASAAGAAAAAPSAPSSILLFLSSSHRQLKTRNLGQAQRAVALLPAVGLLQLGQSLGARQHAAATAQSAANPQLLSIVMAVESCYVPLKSSQAEAVGTNQ